MPPPSLLEKLLCCFSLSLSLSLSESAAAGGCCKVKMKMKIMNNDLSLDSQVCLMCSNIGQNISLTSHHFNVMIFNEKLTVSFCSRSIKNISAFHFVFFKVAHAIYPRGVEFVAILVFNSAKPVCPLSLYSPRVRTCRRNMRWWGPTSLLMIFDDVVF